MATIRQGNNEFKIRAIDAIKLLLGWVVLIPTKPPIVSPPPSGINPPTQPPFEIK